MCRKKPSRKRVIPRDIEKAELEQLEHSNTGLRWTNHLSAARYEAPATYWYDNMKVAGKS